MAEDVSSMVHLRSSNRKRTAQWIDHGKASNHFPESKLYLQKIMVTLW